jgi:hypothetical protein
MPTPAQLEQRLTPVLVELAFPAAPWQISAAADYYGADSHTLWILRGLRARTYPSLRAVVQELTATGPAPPRPAAPAPPPAAPAPALASAAHAPAWRRPGTSTATTDRARHRVVSGR